MVAAGGIGDAILLAVVLPRFLSAAADGEKVTLLLRGNAAKVAFLFPSSLEILAVDFDRLRKASAYRREMFENLHAAHYRLVISLDFLRHPLLDEALIAACGAEAVAMEPRGWPKYDRQLARNRDLYARLYDSGSVHTDKLLRWTGFANWLTGTTAPPPRVALHGVELPDLEKSQPEVIFMPFSAVRQKQSPVSLYRDVIASLPAGTKIVMAGAPKDLDRNPDYRDLIEEYGVEFDDNSFEILAPRLRAARLVVAVDTAGMHLAVALGAPTLCLASAAYIGEIVPYADDIRPDNAHFMYTPMDCQGCLGACIHPPDHDMFPCVAQLDPHAVTSRACEIFRTEAPT